EGGFKILSIYQQSTPQLPQLSTNNLTPDTRHLTPTLSLTWESTPGSTYRVLYKNTLDDPEWTDASGDITAASDKTSWTDETPQDVTSRFYCILLIPAF